MVFDGFDFVPGGIALRMRYTDMYLFGIAIETDNDIPAIVNTISRDKPGTGLSQ